MSREMVNPKHDLFVPCNDEKTRFLPNPHSWTNPAHLSHFRVLGRFMAKALFDGHLIDAYLEFRTPRVSIVVDDS